LRRLKLEDTPSVSSGSFIRGSNTIEEYKKRQAFIEEIVETVLPIEPTLIKEVKNVMLTYRNFGRNTAITDFFLSGTLKRYGKVFLMTGNNKDFPTVIFDREGIITNDISKEPKFYGIYKFSENKHASILKTLLEIEEKAKNKDADQEK